MRVCIAFAFAALFALTALVAQGAERQNVPVPPARPEEVAPPPAATTPTPPAKPDVAPPSSPDALKAPDASPPPTPAPEPGIPNTAVTASQACLERLHHLGVAVTAAKPETSGDCAVATPVEMSSAGEDIAVSPPATLDCETAESVARWIREAVAPEAKEHLDKPLKSIAIAGSFVCRTRNNVAGAQTSEHAFGHAVDIAAFKTDDGSFTMAASPGQAKEAQAFIEAVRRSACSYFTTVLGPGSDPEHADHLHLDTKARENGYRICE